MDADSRVVQALLVKDGRISELGTTSSIMNKVSASVRVIDLQGRTLIPGFVDAHSHFPASGISAVSVDLSQPPIGVTDSLQGLLDQIALAAKSRSGSEWLLGFNYDNTALRNGKHPTRQQLDAVAPDHAVYLWHSSGHMGVANSKALSLLGIDENSVAPAGGVYGRDLQTGLLNGLLQEAAAPLLATIVKEFSLSKQFRVLTWARDDYLSQGVTTVQNGYAGVTMMRVLQLAKKFGVIPQRVIVWPAHAKNNSFDKPGPEISEFEYKVGAIKILVDGSPQGMTAYLSEPYFNTRDNPADYRGFALIDQLALTELVSRFHAAGHQLALHGNGDAAIEYIIDAVEVAQTAHPRTDARHIIVHAQTIRLDQLARLNALSLTPSFFTSHTFYWGDWHRKQSLGSVRASNISPAHWASVAGVPYTLHTDAPVTPMKPMQLLWSASNRMSSTGFELGRHQRISTDAALRAITIDAAWQNHVEDAVGSLEPGKLADMVVLSDNPYTATDVRELAVLATYISGIQRYRHPSWLDTD